MKYKLWFIAVALFIIGAGLNLLVTLANGGMPTRLTVVNVSAFWKVWVPLTEQIKFPFLGDVIPIPWGCISIGDILAVLGAELAFFLLIRRELNYRRRKKAKQ